MTRSSFLWLLLMLACGPVKKGSPAGIYAPTERDAQVSLVGDMLMGRVAGLEVRRAPRGHTYRIRGPRRLIGSEEPLLVLDDFPMPIAFLNTLDPQDIAQVYVLRDVALYGSRGFNGVLVVKTKGGRF